MPDVQPDPEHGPAQIVARLTAWVEATPWVQWLEIAGSLGRGAGDARSDVDAGIGIDADRPFARSRDDALVAASGFAVVADRLVQPLRNDPPVDHLIIQYEDGRQLSLVVSPGHLRPGLPPGARAPFDRTGQLAATWHPDSLKATQRELREWGFLAWWALLDVVKHTERRTLWRAVTALDEARGLTWKLHAAALGVDYPMFGAVSVDNANLAAPQGLEKSLPARLDPAAITAGARALAATLAPLTADLDVDRIHRLADERVRSILRS